MFGAGSARRGLPERMPAARSAFLQIDNARFDAAGDNPACGRIPALLADAVGAVGGLVSAAGIPHGSKWITVSAAVQVQADAAGLPG